MAAQFLLSLCATLLVAGGAMAQPTAPSPAASAAAGAAPAFDLVSSVLSQYKLDTWQAEQGVPVGAVQSVHQSRDGTLWVGTGSGLARFDGLRMSAVEAPRVPALTRRPIFGFLEDAEGHLWIGHAGGAARYRNGEFEPMIDPALLQGRRVWAFAQGPDRTVWIATENGLLRWQDGAMKALRVADGLPTDRLRTLAFDRAGVLWIGTTGGGLVRYQGGRFETLGPAEGFPHTEVRHLLADPAGGIWAATPGAGLVHLEDGRIRRYTEADGLPSDQLTYLARDREGGLWIGTWGAGVSRWHQGRFSTLTSDAGLGGDQIWTVHADREGSLWVGNWNSGLNRLRPRVFPVVGKPEGLPHDNIRSVLQSRAGHLWVATAGGGAARVEPGGIQLLNQKSGLPTNEMSTLYEDADGAIWLGSYTDGLVRWDQGRLQRFGVDAGLPNPDVRALLRDRAGTLWVGTRAGLARSEGRAFQPVTEPGAPTEGVVAILQDRHGTVWFATTGDGLVRYRDGQFSRMTRQDGLASNWILSLHEDSAGSLWIGTNGEGIHRLREGRLSTVRVADGLWDGLAQVFLEDRQGRLWMSCNRGIFSIPRAELDAFVEGRIPRVRATGYGAGDALRSPTFAGGLQGAGMMDASGLLWLPSLKGLVRVDPAHLPPALEAPPVRIEAVSLSGKPMALEPTLQLPPGAVPPLTIRYAAATVLHAERVRFRYRMEGMMPEWVEVGGSREATFPSLPHGRYAFRIGVTLDGEHWREAAALPVVVAPHYYQTLWFQLLLALAVVLAVLLLFMVRSRQMGRRHLEMERLVSEKTEALRLANEHLSRLSFSDALTGLANRRRFDEQLDVEWRRTARQQLPLAVIMADIDAFKAYNDTLGHAAGDQCLCAVAEVIRHTTSRAGDFAARYGGEEFVLLIPGLAAAEARAYAEHLRAACEARALPHPASPVGPVVTLSIGVASWVPSAASTPTALFAAADAALYRAKQEGRNRVA